MSHAIDRAFDAYERGAITRRDLMSAVVSFVALGSGACAALADGAPGPAPAAKPAPGRAHLNHVNLRVADVQRSHEFYNRFFGLELTKTPTYNALDCGGGTFISLQTKANVEMETFRVSPGAVEWARTPNEPAGIIEHFCLEVDGLDLDATREALKEAGHEVVEISENLLTADPDGVLVQIVDSDLKFLHEDEELLRSVWEQVREQNR